MSEQHQQLKAVHIFKPGFIASKTVFYGCFMLPFKDELIARFAGVLNMWAKGKHLTTVTIGTNFATIELIISGLLRVNCAAIPENLIEAELFGVEKGAYTGAQQTRMGRFERADGGTLFLDEVGELPLAAQAKLLRVLQEGEIERLGDHKVRKVNVRLVTATHVDLKQAVSEGRFRADLYYRIHVYPVHIPPLRERQSDIPLLVNAMLERLSVLHEKPTAGITDRALAALLQHPWPGNVRELENTIELGLILAEPGGLIEVNHLFPQQQAMNNTGLDQGGHLQAATPTAEHDLYEQMLNSGLSFDDIERNFLNHAVKKADGNLSRAARMLGITRPQLAYRLKKTST